MAMINRRYEEERSVDSMVGYLRDWTGVILRLDGVLNWESPWLLVAMILILSTVFLALHTIGPSVITTLGWFGLTFSILNYFGPFFSARITTDLSPLEYGRRYRVFCRRVVHIRYLFIGIISFIFDLRCNHRLLYIFTIVPILIIGAFIGCQINDLSVFYLLTMGSLLTPGIRHKGIFLILTYPITCWLKWLASGLSRRLPTPASLTNFVKHIFLWPWFIARWLFSKKHE